jgi:hypothetical protein
MRKTDTAWCSTKSRTRSCFVPWVRSDTARNSKVSYAVATVRGRLQRVVMAIRRVGNNLLERHESANSVSGIDEESVGQRPHHAAIAIVEGANCQQVKGEEPDEQDRVVVTALGLLVEASDEFGREELRARGGDWDEPDLDGAVGRMVDDQFVAGLESSAAAFGPCEEQGLTMQQQTDVQR